MSTTAGNGVRGGRRLSKSVMRERWQHRLLAQWMHGRSMAGTDEGEGSGINKSIADLQLHADSIDDFCAQTGIRSERVDVVLGNDEVDDAMRIIAQPTD